MNIVNKDILESTEKYILHQVNCQNKMGSGLAKVLYTKYPKVKEYYHLLFEKFSSEELLGSSGLVQIDDSRTIVNCFTQFNYGYDGALYTDYNAIRHCFNNIKSVLLDEKDCVAIPYGYGCGLGGGDWNIVSSIIEEIFGDKAVVYKLV